jgi:hypothetical protein
MEAKRKIKAKNFLKNLRAGMTESQLMEMYSLSAEGLQRVLGKLAAAGLLETGELGPSLSETGKEPLAGAGRRLRRCYPAFFIPVYDLDDLLAEGQLHDLNEKGMRVSGISSRPGAEMNLVIQADEVADVYPFCVGAKCRWTAVESDGRLIAGFEVTSWPPVAAEALEKIMKSLMICDDV